MVEVVVIGNIAFDINTYKLDNNKTIINNGGAAYYSAIPASLYTKVGIVSRVGNDFDTKILTKNRNLDLLGLKILNNYKTTKFYHIYITKDGKERLFREDVVPQTITRKEDIPKKYLNAKYIHVAANLPSKQKQFLEYIRENSNSIISIDTHEAYINKESKLIKKNFDMADIAFIDEQYKFLYNCNAKVKIIKKGKDGCEYISKDKAFKIDTEKKVEYVKDKTGAGDVLAGVFLANLSLGFDDEYSLGEGVKLATKSIINYGVDHLIGE